MTNEQLTEGLKNKQYQDLFSVLQFAKNIIDKGNSLSSTNEQLIVVLFDLKNIKELYEKINEVSSLDKNTINEYQSSISHYKINATEVEELEDELVVSLNQTFDSYKNGFGTILVANVIIIMTAILSYITVSSGTSLEEIKDTATMVLIVNFICYIIFLIGIFILTLKIMDFYYLNKIKCFILVLIPSFKLFSSKFY
jgi:hypothetical protein